MDKMEEKGQIPDKVQKCYGFQREYFCGIRLILNCPFQNPCDCEKN